jgi:hypothetical protein
VARSLEFRWDDFRMLSEHRVPPEQLSMWRQYFETVNFDFAVKAGRGGTFLAYLGLAIRSDTGFAEIIAAALEPTALEALRSCLIAVIDELQARKETYLGIKPLLVSGCDAILEECSFRGK